MVTSIAGFNPAATGNIIGSFAKTTRGFIQGMAQDDPSIYALLHGGVLASTETIPMWGGVAIGEYIPVAGSEQLGPNLQRSVVNSGITAFSVFNQGANAIVLPNGGIPLFYSGQKVSYFKLGSNARIPLQIDPALINQDGNLVTTQFSWDFTLQRIGLYAPAYAQQTPSAYTSYTSSTGVLVLTFTTAPGVQAGEYVTLAGFTGGNTALNGDFSVISTASAGTVLNIQAPTGLGTLTLSAGYLAAGGGALAIRSVDAVFGSGQKIVTYVPSTGAISWTESGAIALVTL